ncbi:hypothetical protein HRbin36_00677 [bacterium HR36]|nr:hypothetical protein HRbin36_00677 [bacterium HR36]
MRVTDQQLAILDLARADWLEKVPWPERWRELALLGASLSESEWVWQVWDDVLETYLNTVESLQPHQAIRNREFAKNAVHRRMELWASWVSARQQEEEQCRAVLVSRLYTHDRV